MSEKIILSCCLITNLVIYSISKIGELMKQDFRAFFLAMSELEKATYAKKAGTTAGYIQAHLITRYKVPRKKLMQSLADASGDKVSVADLTNFFYAKFEIKEKEAIRKTSVRFF